MPVHHPWRLVPLACIAALLPAPASTQAADADLDPSFGTGGIAFTPLGDVDAGFSPRVAEAPDGGLIVAGPVDPVSGSSYRVEFRRLDPGGNLDSAFGTPGVAAGYPSMLDLRILADGRIVAAYYDDGDVTVARRQATGAPAGESTHGPPCGSGYPLGAAIDASGRTYVGWSCTDGGSDVVHAIGPDGTTDSGFGPDGVRVLEPDGDSQTVPRFVDLDVGPDDKPVVATSAYSDTLYTLVHRFLASGGYDASFGGDGRAAVAGIPRKLAVADDGKVVVAQEGSPLAFVRLLASGAPDDVFGTDGRANVSGPICCPSNIGLTVGGERIFALAAHYEPGGGEGETSLELIRLTGAGAPDPAFGDDGFQTLTMSDDTQLRGRGAPAVQDDGRLLVALSLRGDSTRRSIAFDAPPGHSFAIARLGEPGTARPAPPEPPSVAQPPLGGSASDVHVPVLPSLAPPRSTPQRRCSGRRRFTIRLRTGRPRGERSPIVSARVLVNGAPAKRAGSTASIDLTNLPQGRFTVRIRLRLADGGIVRETRRYRTCTRKIEGKLKRLRTRAPKSKRRG